MIIAQNQLIRRYLKILQQFGVFNILHTILNAIKMLSRTPVVRVSDAKPKKNAAVTIS